MYLSNIIAKKIPNVKYAQCCHEALVVFWREIVLLHDVKNKWRKNSDIIEVFVFVWNSLLVIVFGGKTSGEKIKLGKIQNIRGKVDTKRMN